MYFFKHYVDFQTYPKPLGGRVCSHRSLRRSRHIFGFSYAERFFVSAKVLSLVALWNAESNQLGQDVEDAIALSHCRPQCILGCRDLHFRSIEEDLATFNTLERKLVTNNTILW